MGGLPLHPAHGGHQIIPEEDQIVQDGHDGGHHAHQGEHTDGGDLQQAADDVKGKEGGIKPGQPLDLDGDHKEKQHLHVPVQGGKGEEQGQVHIVHGDGSHRVGQNQINDKARDDVEHQSQQVEHGKLGGAPLPLQNGADPVVKIQRDGQEKQAVVFRHKDKGDQPPHLAPQNVVGNKGQSGGQGKAHAELVQQPHQRIADDHHHHQIGDTEPGMLVAEPIQPVLNESQRILPPVGQHAAPFSMCPSVAGPRGKFPNKL